MKRNIAGTRRAILAFLGALPMPLLSVRSEAQTRQLELASYLLGPTLVGPRLQSFIDKVAGGSAGTLQVSVETLAPVMPFRMMSEASAFAHYYAALFADVEPVFRLAALPMLAASFDEAETLLRIARPHYVAALARHGQVLLATEPWQPNALWSTVPIRSIADIKGIPFSMSTPFGQQAGWGRPIIRAGARAASFFEAELVLSNGYNISLKLSREFAWFTEIFLAVPINFLTASREVFDSLTEAQRGVLVAAGRDTELALWKFGRELLASEHNEIAARGVTVIARPAADLMAGLRTAAAPDIQSWVQSMGVEGAAILADYRLAIGRE